MDGHTFCWRSLADDLHIGEVVEEVLSAIVTTSHTLSEAHEGFDSQRITSFISTTCQQSLARLTVFTRSPNSGTYQSVSCDGRQR